MSSPGKWFSHATPLVVMHDVGHRYGSGPARVEALRGLTLSIHPGEAVAICGPSGSGKTTALLCLGLLMSPNGGGEIYIEGMPVSALGQRARTVLRRDQVGYVFQDFKLLPSLSAWQNVTLGSTQRSSRRETRRRACELLERLGLGDRISHRPAALSGGQKQRVAVARALINSPNLVLADEPTGNLDTAAGHAVLAELITTARHVGSGVAIVTHDDRVAQRLDRIITVVDGRVREPAAASVAHRRPPINNVLESSNIDSTNASKV